MSEQPYNEIMRAIGRLEGKMDGVADSLTKIETSVTGHSKDITELKQAESYRRGQSALISTLVSIAVSLISVFFKRG